MSDNEVDRLEREQRDADARYNDALTRLDRAVVETNGRPLRREDFDLLPTAPVVFLQQITAFVDTKDRAAAAAMSARFDRLDGALDAIAEMRAQIAFLQRAVQKLTREGQPPAMNPDPRVPDPRIPNPESQI